MSTLPSARAARPATPSADLAAWSRSSAQKLLSPEMAEFCSSGVSVVVAACGSDGRAIAGLALGARSGPDGGMRVLLRQPANRALLAAIAVGSAIAATFSRPQDHKSVQLKSRSAEIMDATPEDLAALAAHAATFRDVLIELDYNAAFSALYGAYVPAEVVALSFMPERAFVQTPGPGAGCEIRP